MTDLPGTAAISLEQAPVDQNARANAVFHVDDDQVFIARMPTAIHKLADGSRLAVIQYRDGELVFFLEHLPKRQVAPVQVDGVDHDALPGIHQARCANANPNDGLDPLPEELVDQFEDKLKSLVTIAVLNRRLDRFPDFPSQVHNRADEFIPGKVQSDQITGVRRHTEQDGGFPANGFTDSHLFHKAFLQQSADDLGHRCTGEVGDTCDLRPADGVARKDGTEYKIAVVLLRMLAGRLLHAWAAPR